MASVTEEPTLGVMPCGSLSISLAKDGNRPFVDWKAAEQCFTLRRVLRSTDGEDPKKCAAPLQIRCIAGPICKSGCLIERSHLADADGKLFANLVAAQKAVLTDAEKRPEYKGYRILTLRLDLNDADLFVATDDRGVPDPLLPDHVEAVEIAQVSWEELSVHFRGWAYPEFKCVLVMLCTPDLKMAMGRAPCGCAGDKAGADACTHERDEDDQTDDMKELKQGVASMGLVTAPQAAALGLAQRRMVRAKRRDRSQPTKSA